MTEPPFTEQYHPSKPLEPAEIPAGSPPMYLWTLAHDLLLAEGVSRRAETGPDYWHRPTLAYVYAQATRWFDLEPIHYGADHQTIVANAVARTGACPFCLYLGGGHTESCQVPF